MEGGQNKILECSSTKLGTICKLTGTVFVWLQQTLAFLSNCISIKPAQLLALAVPMAILAWSTATFLYTSKCSFFFSQSKYTLFERPLLLPWTGDGFDDSCTYEHTSLVAILQVEKCTPEAPVSSIAGFQGHHRSPIHDLQQVKKIVNKGRTSGKVNVRHRAYAELAARFISEHLGHK